MKEKTYIVAASAFASTAVEPPLNIKDLLQDACGARPRRTNRATDLALLGACRCALGKIDNPQKVGLYMGSGQGNSADTSDILQQILVQSIEPMPLTFINVSSNMPGYYIAQQLGLTGRNLSISAGPASFDAVTRLAIMDLECGAVEQALVGSVEECAYPLADYRTRLTDDKGMALAESSSWLMLSRTPGERPLAELILCRHFSDMDTALAALEQLPQPTRYICATPPPPEVAEVLKGLESLSDEVPGYSMGIRAWQLVKAIEHGEVDSLLYLRGNAEEGLFIMVLRGCR